MRNLYIPYPSKILEVIRHTEEEFTFRMEYKGKEEVKLGQFFEISIPKYDKAPTSVPGIGEGFVDLIVRKVGRVTSEVPGNYEGDTLLLRDPHGNGFDTKLYKGGETVVVVGGTGVSPMHDVIEALSDSESTKQKYVVAGFRNSADMLFRDGLTDWRDKLSLVLTVSGVPEGYEGNTGLATKCIADLPFADPAKAKTIVVGPPPMMRFTITELLKKSFEEKNITVSYEGKMRYDLGKCGHCRVSDTYTYLDGPVLNYVEAKEMID